MPPCLKQVTCLKTARSLFAYNIEIHSEIIGWTRFEDRNIKTAATNILVDKIEGELYKLIKVFSCKFFSWGMWNMDPKWFKVLKLTYTVKTQFCSRPNFMKLGIFYLFIYPWCIYYDLYVHLLDTCFTGYWGIFPPYDDGLRLRLRWKPDSAHRNTTGICSSWKVPNRGAMLCCSGFSCAIYTPDLRRD